MGRRTTSVGRRRNYGPFNYNGYNAMPLFNPAFGGWGFWFFGTWIPLY